MSALDDFINGGYDGMLYPVKELSDIDEPDTLTDAVKALPNKRMPLLSTANSIIDAAKLATQYLQQDAYRLAVVNNDNLAYDIKTIYVLCYVNSDMYDYVYVQTILQRMSRVAKMMLACKPCCPYSVMETLSIGLVDGIDFIINEDWFRIEQYKLEQY